MWFALAPHFINQFKILVEGNDSLAHWNAFKKSLIPSSQSQGPEPIAQVSGHWAVLAAHLALCSSNTSSSPQSCFVLGSLPWRSLEDIFKICLPLSKATQNDYLPAERKSRSVILNNAVFGWMQLFVRELTGTDSTLFFQVWIWEGLRTCSGR